MFLVSNSSTSLIPFSQTFWNSYSMINKCSYTLILFFPQPHLLLPWSSSFPWTAGLHWALDPHSHQLASSTIFPILMNLQTCHCWIPKPWSYHWLLFFSNTAPSNSLGRKSSGFPYESEQKPKILQQATHPTWSGPLISLALLSLIHFGPTTFDLLAVAQDPKYTLTSGPLQWLFLLSETLFPHRAPSFPSFS